MSATHQRDLLQKLMVLLFLLYLTFWFSLWLADRKGRIWSQNQHFAQQPALSPKQPPRRKLPKPWCPGSFKEMKEDTTEPSWLILYRLISQATRILSKCHLHFFTSLRDAYTTALSIQSPYFRKPLKVDVGSSGSSSDAQPQQVKEEDWGWHLWVSGTWTP